jgi:hypothetical protein
MVSARAGDDPCAILAAFAAGISQGPSCPGQIIQGLTAQPYTESAQTGAKAAPIFYTTKMVSRPIWKNGYTVFGFSID